VVRRSSAQATALLRLTPRTTRRSSLQGLHLPRRLLLLPEMAKREAPSDPELLALLAEAILETPLAIRRLPEANLLVKATQLFLEMVLPVPANRPLAERDLGLRRTEQHLARARLQELQLRPVEDSLFLLARARQYLQCPGPSAFFRETPVARKCNRAARCDALPICAQYRPPHNRRALAGCDNKCSRSQRKHARRA
jgi:hypothetical protein